MAIRTTTQAGSWSDAATWGGSAPPGNGDTAAIGHDVVVDVNVIIGTSGVTGSVAIEVTGSGVELSIAAGVSLRARGDVKFNNNTIFRQLAGSELVLDSSQAAAPSTTQYVLRLGTGYPTGVQWIGSGVAGSPVTIRSDENGMAGYIYPAHALAVIQLTFPYFERLGSSPTTNSIRFFGDENCDVSVTDGKFVRLKDKILWSHFNSNIDDWVWERNEFIGTESTDCVHVDISAGGVGVRSMQGNYFDKRVTFLRGVVGWTLDDSIFHRINATEVGALASALNTVFIEDQGISSTFNFGPASGMVEDFLFLYNNRVSGHTEAGFGQTGMTFRGGVVENTFNRATAPNLLTPSVTTASEAFPTIERTIFVPNAGGGSPCVAIQLKGTKYTKARFVKNTAAIAYDTSPSGMVVTSHGGESRGWPGHVDLFQDNLFYSPLETPSDALDFGISCVRNEAIETGVVGQVGSSPTILVAPSALFLTGNRSQEGYRVVVTSGASAGESREVVSNTDTSVTVSPAFSASLVGQTCDVFPLEEITTASHNAWAGLPSTGDVYDENNTLVTNEKLGYDGFNTANAALIGANDVILSSVNFIDSSRRLATWPIDSLGNTTNPAWASGVSYAIGDGVSRAVVGFYGGATINYRARVAHTSSSSDAPGGFVNTWQSNWELEAIYELRRAHLQEAGYNANAHVSNYITWIREGFAPTNTSLVAAASDGEDIGAVAVEPLSSFIQRIGIKISLGL